MATAIQAGETAITFNDPGYSYQWHINPDSAWNQGWDLNIQGAWEDYAGGGVKVGVVDQGVDSDHADLDDNYDTDNDRDWTLKDSDDGSYDGDAKPSNANHGTPVAGIIGAEGGNGEGGVGIAYESTIVSHTINLGNQSDGDARHFWQGYNDALRAQSEVDVSNNSWGYSTYMYELTDMEASIQHATTEGRDGLGTVMVFAAGNGGADGGSSDYSIPSSTRETLSVAAVEQDGETAYYSNPGSSLLVSGLTNIYTTDRTDGGYSSGDYVSGFNGTSAAAPTVSGVVALMLEANPELGYRDVQQILAASSRITTEASEGSYQINGAGNVNGGGMHFSHDYGYGLIDATAAVRLAETWSKQSTAANEVSSQQAQQSFGTTLNEGNAIEDGQTWSDSFTVSVDQPMTIEAVEVKVKLTHEHLGDLVIELVSPDGTVSELMARPGTGYNGGSGGDGTYSQSSLDYTFTTQAHRGELLEDGQEWQIRIRDEKTGDEGYIKSYQLSFHGEADSADDTYIYTNEFGRMVEGIAGEGEPAGARQTLTDTDGGIDTLNAAAVSGDMVLNLNEGATNTLAGSSFVIAEGSVIENAIAGDGDDSITGNQANNILQGGRGDDMLVGGAGDDMLFGDLEGLNAAADGNDVLAGGDGNDMLVGGAGSDTYIFEGDWDLDQITDVDGGLILFAVNSLSDIFESFDFSESDSGWSLSEHFGDDAFQVNGLDSLADWSFGWFTGEDYTGDYTDISFEDLLYDGSDENHAPDAEEDKELVGQEDTALALNIAAPTDEDGDALAIMVTTVPDASTSGRILKADGTQVQPGMTLTTEELTSLTFDPVENFYGEAGLFSYTVNDGNGPSDSQTVTIKVEPVNDAPHVTWEIPDQEATEDEAFSYNAGTHFDDVDNAAGEMTFSATLADGSPLPEWLSIDPETGYLSGTPLEGDDGAYQIVMRATDPEGAFVEETFAMTVQAVNDEPVVISPITDQEVDEDSVFSYNAAAHFDDVDAGDTLTYSATLDNGAPLPDWLSIDPATGTLSGTPEEGDDGTYTVSVTATDQEGASANTSFVLQVNAVNDEPVVVMPIDDFAFEEGKAVSIETATHFADEDEGDMLTFSATLADGSDLPAWLSIDANTGTISGTAPEGAAGDYDIVVTATDSAGAAVSEDFTLTIEGTEDDSTWGDWENSYEIHDEWSWDWGQSSYSWVEDGTRYFNDGSDSFYETTQTVYEYDSHYSYDSYSSDYYSYSVSDNKHYYNAEEGFNLRVSDSEGFSEGSSSYGESSSSYDYTNVYYVDNGNNIQLSYYEGNSESQYDYGSWDYNYLSEYGNFSYSEDNYYVWSYDSDSVDQDSGNSTEYAYSYMYYMDPDSYSWELVASTDMSFKDMTDTDQASDMLDWGDTNALASEAKEVVNLDQLEALLDWARSEIWEHEGYADMTMAATTDLMPSVAPVDNDEMAEPMGAAA